MSHHLVGTYLTVTLLETDGIMIMFSDNKITITSLFRLPKPFLKA